MITVRRHGKYSVRVFKCNYCGCLFSAGKKDYEIIIKPVKIKDDFGWFRSVECATYKITCPDCNATDFYNEISKPDSVEYPYVSGSCWQDEESY